MNPEDLKTMADVIPEKSRNAFFEAPLRSLGYAINGYLNWNFGPLIQMGAVSDAATKSLASSIEEKTKNLKEEDFDRTKLGIALKAMNDSTYQIENDTLREMFANLISNSINKQKNFDASPLMVNTISSMSPESAEFLSKWHNIFPEKVSTLCSIEKVTMKNEQEIGRAPLLQNIIVLKDLSVYRKEYVIDELRQLGIFELHMDGNLTDPAWEKHYEIVENMASNTIIAVQNSDDMTENAVAKKGYIRLSPFGGALLRLLFN